MRPITSPSNLYRRALCPGSQAMEEQVRERGLAIGAVESTSPEAEEGTALHNVMAGKFTPPKEWWTEDREYAIGEAKKGDDLALEKAFGQNPENLELHREIKLEDEHGEGTADLVACVKDSASLVRDYKFGRIGAASAESNYQTMWYAVMESKRSGHRRVFVSLGQPFLDKDHRESIAVYEGPDLDAAHMTVATIISKCSAVDAPRVPSMEACRYCTARSICPEARKYQTELVKKASEGMAITKDNARAVWEAARLAEAVVKEVKEKVKEIVSTTGAPGLAMKPGAREPVWGPTQKVFEASGLEPEVFVNATIPALGPLEELWVKHHPEFETKKAAKEAFRKQMLDSGVLQYRPKASSVVTSD